MDRKIGCIVEVLLEDSLTSSFSDLLPDLFTQKLFYRVAECVRCGLFSCGSRFSESSC